jgi:Arc/MetJ-type ribon-helix-helix transcriptional regulator
MSPAPIPCVAWHKEQSTTDKVDRLHIAELRSESSHMRETARPAVHGMVHGMATTKITITLPDRQLEQIRKRVAAEDSPSVSGFIQQAVQRSLENAAEFRAMVEQALKETGGPLKPRERAWARKMLSARKRRTKPRKAA